ncbi:MAG: hypothetical protein ACXABY_06210 [Candidatus Thorarchaeota archaeon]
MHLPFATLILSALLPYGVITYGTMIFSTNQQWLFPFWYYIHDFGNWFGPGLIVPVFTDPQYPFSFVLLGLLWFVVGISTSKLLHSLHLNQIEKRLGQFLLLGTLVSQLLLTFPALSFGYGYTLDYAIPIPIHTLLMLMLTGFAPEESVD